jgi:hypothetical protein
MPTDDPETITIDVQIQKLDAHGPVSNWADDTKLWLSFNDVDKTIGIAGNRAALNSLARHLLTLTQPGTQPGYNLSWDPESGWFATDDAGLHLSLTE